MNAFEFLHCNACFAIPPEGTAPSGDYFITNCGHTLCKNCINHSDAVPKCRKCGNAYKSIPLTSDLQGTMKFLFAPIGKIIKDTFKIFLVQNGHSKIFIEEYMPKLESSNKEQIEKLNELRREINALQNKYSSLFLENKTLKQQLHSMSAQIQHSRIKAPFKPSPAFGNFGGPSFDPRYASSGLLTPSPSTVSPASRANSSQGMHTSQQVTPNTIFLRPSVSPISDKSYQKSSLFGLRTPEARGTVRSSNRDLSKPPPLGNEFLKRVHQSTTRIPGFEKKPVYRPQQFKLSSQPFVRSTGKFSERKSESSMRSVSPCSSLQSFNSARTPSSFLQGGLRSSGNSFRNKPMF